MTFRLLAPRLKHHLSAGQIDQALYLLQSMLVGHPLEHSILVRAAVRYGIWMEVLQGQKDWREAKLDAQTIRKALLQIVEEVEQEEIKSTRVVLYQVGEIDQALVEQLQQVLVEHGFQVTILGHHPKSANSVLAQAHYLILLLAPSDNISAQLDQVITQAGQAQAPIGQAQVIPVQVAWPRQQKITTNLNSTISPSQYLTWQQVNDTPQLIRQILDLLYFRSAPYSKVSSPPASKAKQKAFHFWTFPLWYFLLAGLFMLSFKCGN